MNKDVFIWNMTAYEARSGINAFRKELAEHVAAQQPLPLALFIGLLPLNPDNPREFANRGSFKIAGNKFENVSRNELRLSINDPTMKHYTIIIPPVWAGAISIAGNIIKITFEHPLRMVIPAIEDLGINRSEYQSIALIESDLRYVQTHLIDENSTDNEILETVVRVEYNPHAAQEIDEAGSDATKLRVFNSFQASCGGLFNPDDPGPGDPANPPAPATDWYVFRRRTDGLALIHEGTVLEGGQVGYDRIFGPRTNDECTNYVNTNCPDEICPRPL
jgi:hypothetical protein